jgi:hypothetical protein
MDATSSAAHKTLSIPRGSGWAGGVLLRGASPRVELDPGQANVAQRGLQRLPLQLITTHGSEPRASATLPHPGRWCR